MFTQNKDETDTFGHNELNSDVATQRTVNQSPGGVVARRTSEQSSKSALPPTVTPPKNTKKQKHQRQNKKKSSMLHQTITKQTRKRVVSCKTKTKQRRKNKIRPRNRNRRIKKSEMTKNECTLEAEVLVDLAHDSTTFCIFQTVTEMNELLEMIVTETNG